ncbi:hypothetical protein [Bradyrhizobium sp. LA6.12]|uniref:hypothetical protein n=1 Tax=unclassified Bradyrhizobium TaxID=2631580 RepID=UPI0033960731
MILKTGGLQVGQFSASGDPNDKTGGITRFSVRLKPRRDARQPFRRKAESVRIADDLQIVGKRRIHQQRKRRQRSQ